MPQFWFHCSGTCLCITLDMPDFVYFLWEIMYQGVQLKQELLEEVSAKIVSFDIACNILL